METAKQCLMFLPIMKVGFMTSRNCKCDKMLAFNWTKKIILKKGNKDAKIQYAHYLTDEISIGFLI